MKKNFYIGTFLGVVFAAAPALAASYETLAARADAAARVLQEQTDSRFDQMIPSNLLQRAQCVVVVPQIYKAAFIFSVRHGHGLASCRSESGWSNPVFVNLTGIGWGFQAGLQASDIVLVLPRDNAPERLAQRNITLGADVSVAVGPVGRRAEASTDWILQSEIYSYSRNRGVFVGASLEGAKLSPDMSDNHDFYGARTNTLGTLSTMGSAAGASNFINTLNRLAP